ncbi:MAG: glycerol-3-phosphate acyltransferase [Dehalococcoidia bacterium]|jgi:acyl-phosphate glycerol 3-phosphate acyltransferase
MNWISLISIPIAYLLGSLSSAYIVGRFNGKIDIRDEPDGRISAAAVYRRVGPLSFLIVVFMDIGKAMLAVLIAWWMGATLPVILLAGMVTIAAHQWSPFMKFQGGLGATVIGGVMVTIATVPTIIAAAVAAMAAWIIKSSSYGFGIGMVTLGIVLFGMHFANVAVQPFNIITPPPFPPGWMLIVYPLVLLGMMIGKALQIKYRPGTPIIVKLVQDK